jgi:septal ring factor EnvC (AmiA/AmiB activator)
MSSLEEEIANLKNEIEEYKRDLRAAATTEEKREIRVLITASRTNLHDLNAQLERQQG